MSAPLPLIEFAAFMAVVAWLFTMPSSPLRRGDYSSGDGDTAEDQSSDQDGAETDRKEPPHP